MNPSALSFFFGQLGAQAPSLVVCFAGVIAGFAFLRRSRIPALACIFGCGLMMLTAVAVTSAQAWMLGMQLDGTWTSMRYGQAMSVVGIAGGAVRAVGLGFVIAAVFLGREPIRNATP